MSRPPSSSNTLLNIVFLIFSLLVTTVVYWQGLYGSFIFDDFPNIVNNAELRSVAFSFDSLLSAALSSDSGPLSRPISMLSFAVQIAASGLAPFALKFTNLLIHLVNGLLIFFLSKQILDAIQTKTHCDNALSFDRFFPLAVTCAWLLVPINLTSVLYVVQRMESLSTLIMLLSLLAYFRGRLHLNAGHPGGMAWMAGGLAGGTVLGVLAKETAVALPAYAFIIEWVLFGFRSPDNRWNRPVLILFTFALLIPGILGLLATLPAALSGASYINRPFTLAERLMTEGRIVLDYLHWIIAPPAETLTLYHDDYPISRSWLSPIGTIPSIIFLGALLVFALWLKNRRPLITLGLLFFFSGHALVSTYLPLELVYEHRNYLPSFGIFMALFAFILLEPSRIDLRTLRISVTVALLVLYGFLTFLRASEWSYPVRLAFSEAARHPQSPRANYEMGLMLMTTKPTPGEPNFSLAMKSFEVASTLPNAGLLPTQAIIFMRGKYKMPIDEALWERMKLTISSGPLSRQDMNALYSLLNCLTKEECQFEPEKLGEAVELAAIKNPTHPVVLTLRANYAVNIAHDFTLGLNLMQRIVALAPQNPQYWKNLVTLQTSLGQIHEARAGIDRLHELDRFGLQQQSIQALETALSNKKAEILRKFSNRNTS